MNNIVKNINTMLNAEGVNKDLIAVAIKAEARKLAKAGEIDSLKLEAIEILAEGLA